MKVEEFYMRNLFFLILTLYSAVSFAYSPRVKFLFENPSNVNHGKNYGSIRYGVWALQESIFGKSQDDLIKLSSAEVVGFIDKEDRFFSGLRLKKEEERSVSGKVLGEKKLERVIKALFSSILLNRSSEILSLLYSKNGVQDDINSDVYDFLVEYVKNLEEEELGASSNEGDLLEEEALKDKSVDESIAQENPMDIKKALETPFYKRSMELYFDLCSFGPCLRFESGGSKVFFSRNDLRIKEIELELENDEIREPGINEDNKKSLTIKLGEYTKVAGKYFLPKRIKLITETNQLLFKFENLSLKKVKKVKFKERKAEEINQILSI